jgi:hypothetical protein
MKKTHLKQCIQECNLSEEEKKVLIELLDNKSANYSTFILTFLKIVGLSKKAFDVFGIDIRDWLDKFL